MKTQNNTQFFIRLLLLVMVLVIGDFIIGKCLRHAYFNQVSGSLCRTTYAMEKVKSDVLVLGSSRANHHYYIPENDSSFYNAGKDGTSVLYHNALLRSVLKRYTPGKIILDLDVSAFRQSTENYDRLSYLLPYYESHPEIRDIVDLKSSSEKWKMLSSIYPYNSMVLGIAMGHIEKEKRRKRDMNGYVPLNRKWSGALNKVDRSETMDSTLVNAFEELIMNAREAGSEVYVVVSPVYYKYDRSETIEIARKICATHHVQLLDYSRDSLYLGNNEFFADPSHLNDTGAKVFSANLSGKIKNLLHGKS